MSEPSPAVDLVERMAKLIEIAIEECSGVLGPTAYDQARKLAPKLAALSTPAPALLEDGLSRAIRHQVQSGKLAPLNPAPAPALGEEEAREVLASEYECAGFTETAELVRGPIARGIWQPALRAMLSFASLRSPVNEGERS